MNIKKYQLPGSIVENKVEEHSVIIKFNKGVLKIQCINSNCLHVTYNKKGEFLNIPSFAVVKKPKSVDMEIEELSDNIVIKTDKLKVVVEKNGKINFYDIKGNLICEDDNGFILEQDKIECRRIINKCDHIYGLGEKSGYLDKKGEKYLMWNKDNPTRIHTDPLYKSIPLMFSFNPDKCYGIFVDKTCKVWFDFSEEIEGSYSFAVDDFEMDFYFIYGSDLKQLIHEFTNLTGKMYLPPKWALGYQQCRWSYKSEQEVKEIANNFRKKNIPCDVIYLDIDYMNEYRVFTWDDYSFPESEKMINDLKEKGYQVVIIIDPGVKADPEYNIYREGLDRDLFCKYITGDIYHGEVWPGKAAFPDFTKKEVRQWWGEKHKDLFKIGVAGIWNDMNEPSDLSTDDKTVSEDIIMENEGNPRTFRHYNNSYGFNMCRATLEGFNLFKPQTRPFILSRSTYAGGQRLSAAWTGDNSSTWEHMALAVPKLMNIGLSGISFAGVDVGGFGGNATPELFARWMQFGVFTPFFRGHSARKTKFHEPWKFGKEVEDICRKYIKLRYQLLPYNYNEFFKSSTDGLPIMRPLVLEYPEDESVHNINDQYLYGESIMVAPVLKPSICKRKVYLPEGHWYDFWTDERIRGGKYILVDTPLYKLPVYIKENSIIPMIEDMNYVDEKDVDCLRLHIYFDQNQKYSYTLYEDDGISKEYLKEQYSLTKFELKMIENKIVFQIIPEKKIIKRTGINTRLHCILLKRRSSRLIVVIKLLIKLIKKIKL